MPVRDMGNRSALLSGKPGGKAPMSLEESCGRSKAMSKVNNGVNED